MAAQREPHQVKSNLNNMRTRAHSLSFSLAIALKTMRSVAFALVGSKAGHAS